MGPERKTSSASSDSLMCLTKYHAVCALSWPQHQNCKTAGIGLSSGLGVSRSRSRFRCRPSGMAVRIPSDERPRLRYDGESDAIVCSMWNTLSLGSGMTGWLALMKYNDGDIMRFIQSLGWVMSEDTEALSSNCHQRTGRLSAPGETRLSPLHVGSRQISASEFHGPFGTYRKNHTAGGL